MTPAMWCDQSRAATVRLALALVIVAGVAACDSRIGDESSRIPEAEPTGFTSGDQRYIASLSPINRGLLSANPSGQVELVVGGETVEIVLRTDGMPADTMHMQILHGFADGTPARCPGPGADANHDGVVDVTETQEMAGVAMVPFHEDPVSLDIAADSYPRADAEGSYTYRQVVSRDQFLKAFSDTPGGEPALDRRVVFVHGVREDAELPESARSIPGAPAHATVPVACAELRRVPQRQ
ncbi:MAG: hypothetical protein M3Q42_12785 [Pseudomonadota bacterium]|nr:hypothetical protein [Pseudomonadota bacterium]